MSFTEAEKRAWHAERQAAADKLHDDRSRAMRPQPAAKCFHCGIPFGYGEGHISADFAICDACDSD